MAIVTTGLSHTQMGAIQKCNFPRGDRLWFDAHKDITNIAVEMRGSDNVWHRHLPPSVASKKALDPQVAWETEGVGKLKREEVAHGLCPTTHSH